MFLTRVLTGAVLTVILGLVVYFSHIPAVLNVLIAFLSVKGIVELYKATKLYNNKLITALSCAAAIVISFEDIPDIFCIVGVLFIAAVILFGVLMSKIKEKQKIESILSVIIAVMITFFFKSLSGVRNAENGVYLLGVTMLISVLTDIFAYLCGKGFGKHKLAPVLSPKKTVEGSVGGTMCATAILMIAALLLSNNNVISVNYGILAIYLISASVLGQFGDLAFSSVKRISGIKDYGKLLPGHGGVLDRFDSMLFVAPFTYLFSICANGFITVV